MSLIEKLFGGKKPQERIAVSRIGEKRNPIDGADMVWVEGGEFLMGSTVEHAAAMLDEYPMNFQIFARFLLGAEQPQRKVYLRGYWMYRYPVTVAQYRKFCEATNREMPDIYGGWASKDDHPMVGVNWEDAADYAEWAGVSLPTEAQWEKAARGTDGRTYPWGNTWDVSMCASSVEAKLESTKPVGSYPSGISPYGCMDMSGNVYEWCADWFDPMYYRKAPKKEPPGPSENVRFEIGDPNNINNGARVKRGGSWRQEDLIGPFRCAYRGYNVPQSCSNDCGFRCAKTP